MSGFGIDLRFLLGRYHATPWDRHVNDGAVEWPPTPWRLARALYSIWKERCPHLDESAALAAIEAVSDPPTVDLPPAVAASTRHYYPLAEHRLGASAGTSKVIDAFLALDPDAPVRLRWNATLSTSAENALSSLTEHLTYLGRADSVCEATLTDGSIADGLPAGWQRWRPSPEGERSVLAPRLPLDEAELVVTTDQMRRGRRLVPSGAAPATYIIEESTALRPRQTVRRPSPMPTTMVLGISGRPAPPLAMSIVACEWVRARVVRRLSESGHSGFTGHGSDKSVRRDQHRHGHFFPLAGTDGRIEAIGVWAPEGLDPEVVHALSGLRAVGPRQDDEGYRVKGIGRFDLQPLALGDVDVLGAAVIGPAERWRSVTPFVPGRHQHRRYGEGERIGPLHLDFLRDEVHRELGFRGAPPGIVTVNAGSTPAQRFRRHRLRESLADARAGAMLQLQFDEPVRGPLLLGRFSHFGMGAFVPV